MIGKTSPSTSSESFQMMYVFHLHLCWPENANKIYSFELIRSLNCLNKLVHCQNYINLYNIQVIFLQGVHTMLPISWPVSVVLAVLLSIIHLSYRIATNFHAYPTLFVEQVSFYYQSRRQYTYSFLVVFSYNMIWCCCTQWVSL